MNGLGLLVHKSLQLVEIQLYRVQDLPFLVRVCGAINTQTLQVLLVALYGIVRIAALQTQPAVVFFEYVGFVLGHESFAGACEYALEMRRIGGAITVSVLVIECELQVCESVGGVAKDERSAVEQLDGLQFALLHIQQIHPCRGAIPVAPGEEGGRKNLSLPLPTGEGMVFAGSECVGGNEDVR